MNDFTITIDCDSPAWFLDAEGELEHVLSQLNAKAMLNTPCGHKIVLRTRNGNPTGLMTVSPLNHL